ncbi:hypothetical protein DIPPA_02953 [Diplonema papillatum]|nr:hypothetical protein DIPPA_02953 [Diplonema papillatum]
MEADERYPYGCKLRTEVVLGDFRHFPVELPWAAHFKESAADPSKREVIFRVPEWVAIGVERAPAYPSLDLLCRVLKAVEGPLHRFSHDSLQQAIRCSSRRWG